MRFDGVVATATWRVFLTRVAVTAFIVLALLLLAAADAAGASQSTVDCSATSFAAGSEIEFNDALQCYNTAVSPAAFVITVTAPFESTTGWATPGGGTSAFVPVTQSGAGFSLRIDGNNHLIAGFAGFTDSFLYLDGDAPITLNMVTIGTPSIFDAYSQAVVLTRGELVMLSSLIGRAGPVEGGALHVRGGTAAIFDSRLANGLINPPLGPAVSGVLVDAGTISLVESTGSLIVTDGVATVVRSDIDVETRGGAVSVEQSNLGELQSFGGTTLVRDSNVDDTSVSGGLVVLDNSFVERRFGLGGITVQAGSLILANSTMAGHDVNQLRVDGGDVMVLNSTLTGTLGTSAGNSGSIYVTAGTVVVANSTIANDPNQGNGVDGINVAGGTVRVISSVVNGCTGNPVIDDGNNVGSCFGGAAVELRELADNGCAAGVGPVEPRPCVPVRPLREGSPALGAGTCTGVPVYDRQTVTVAVGDLATDQRGAGFDRTPAGEPGCDPGAVEGLSDRLECAGTDFEVGTEQHFNDAIECFNTAPAAANYRIALAADITSTTAWDSNGFASSFPLITRNGHNGSQLDIDGQGHSLIGQSVPSQVGLLVAAGREHPVSFQNLTVSGASTGILISAKSQVTVSRSTITGNGNGVTAAKASELSIFNSTVAGNSELGVLGLQGSRVTIVDSPINNNGTGGVVAAGAQVSITNSTLANNGGPGLIVDSNQPVALVNSTITGSTGAGVIVYDGAVTISDSTVDGNFSTDVVAGAGASATLTSSLANVCVGAVIDGGDNAGSCFGAPPTVPGG